MRLPTQQPIQGQWWSKCTTQWSQRLQCLPRGGLYTLHVVQYLTGWAAARLRLLGNGFPAGDATEFNDGAPTLAPYSMPAPAVCAVVASGGDNAATAPPNASLSSGGRENCGKRRGMMPGSVHAARTNDTT